MSQQETEESHEQSTSSVRKKRGRQRMTTEAFITKAKHIHGDRYDYSKVVYVQSSAKVTITCPEHGDFTMTPNSHLSEHGCPECALTTTRLTTDEFVTRAKHIHGNRYNYDKTHYTNYKADVMITCLIHGDFEQIPNNHLSGNGCPACYKASL